MSVDSLTPCVIQLESGVLAEGEDISNATLTNPGTTYTFNIYRSAALLTFQASYQGETSPAFKFQSTREGYVPNLVFSDVKAGTKKLDIAVGFNVNNTELKYDDGSGNYVSVAAEQNGAFTLDLTQYGEGYQKDGALVIPFMMDYEGDGCCLDGYYTLTLTFAEPENSEIDPTTASFDKHTPEDVEVALTLNGNTLSGIWNGETQLVEDTDYTVSETTVTLKKEYLTKLDTGSSTVLSFKFSAGEDRTLTLTITDSTPEVEYNYIDSVSWLRKKNGEQWFVKTDETVLTELFAFDPAVAEYDIVIPTSAMAERVAQLVVGFSEAAKADDTVYGRVTDASGETASYRYGAAAKDFKTLAGTDLLLNESPYMSVDSLTPCVIKLESGVLTEDEDISSATLTNPGATYIFNIYRSAAFLTFQASYQGETTPAFKFQSTREGYVPNLVFSDVKAGTKKLDITVGFNVNNTELKYDDGSGNYVSVAAEQNGAFTLDLTQYGEGYQKDGALVIPFMMDYEGDGCCLDGYYTLTLTFAEPENSEIDPTTASFDKHTPEDVEVALTLNGNTLSGIWNGETQLVEDTDYTVSETTVTLKKEYLTKLDTGSSTVLSFKFSAGEDRTLTITVNDSTSSSLHGYVKSITIADTDRLSDHVYFDAFNENQTSYELGTIPDRGMPPTLYLALNNEDEFNNMSVSITLSTAEGTVLSSGTGGFKKNSLIYDDSTGAFKLFGLISNVTDFYKQKPGNYVLSVKVFENGQEDKGDEYHFNFALVPYLDSLTISSNDKQIITDPDISNPSNESTIRTTIFNREYYAETQGSFELSLKLTVKYWLGIDYYSDEYADIAFLFDGEATPAHFARGDSAPAIDTTIDFSACENSDGVYTVPFSLIYGKGDMAVINDYTLYITVSEYSGWEITDYSQGGVYDKGDTVTISVTVEGANADNVTYRWQWTEIRLNAENDRYRGDIENETGSTLTVPTGSSGRRFYRCIVTDKDTGAFQCTDAIVIDVNVGQINAPVIVSQPGQTMQKRNTSGENRSRSKPPREPLT